MIAGMALGRVGLALVLAAAIGSANSAEPAAWRAWLAQQPSTTPVPPVTLPDARALSALQAERAWLARWTAQPPSAAWNDVVAGLVVKYQQNPLRAERAYAYTHTAIHDALVTCAQRRCEPALWPIAMHAAAARMLEHLYPGESRGRLQALGHSAAAAVLAATGEHADAKRAWETGFAVADNAIRRALDDGWDMPKLPPKRPAWKPGVWRASPPLNMYDPAEPNAPRWRTWVLSSAAEIEPPPPPEYGTPAYWKEVDEVRAVAAALTPEQKRIAEEWNLDLGSVTPGGVWNQHTKRLVLAYKLGAADAAQVFSTVNAAMMDAFIACWHAKFKWWTERPVTVIRDRYDPDFLPHVLTPPFPSYVSGHSSASGAGAAVLAAFFPDHAPELERMAEEASMSRLYGGIHFRSDNEAGLALGRKIGARALPREHPVHRLP
jgi:hypothetical protein